MIIGSCTISIRLFGINSLKEKRQLIKRIVETSKNKFNISVAEVNDNDNWGRATIGIACVSNDSRHANEIISKIINHIENLAVGSIVDYQIEIL